MTTVLTQFSLPAPITRDEAKRIFLNTAPTVRRLSVGGFFVDNVVGAVTDD